MVSKKQKWLQEWKKCSKHGNQIEGTPFIAFKIPISTETDWDLNTLMKTTPLSNMNLIISLQIDREREFYNQKDVERLHGVKYIFCPRVWSGKIPNEESVTKFFNEVDHMLEKNSNALIGVHCVHGVNRTGYMICRYLIENKGWDPLKAMEAFEKARGENMKTSGKYFKIIQDLKNRKSLSAKMETKE